MIARILPVILFTLVVPNLYIFRRRMRRHDLAFWQKHLVWLPELCLLIATLTIASTETLSPDNLVYIGYYLVAYMLVALPKLVYLIIGLMLTATGRLCPALKRAVRPASLLLAGITFLSLAYGAFLGPNRLEVREAEYRSTVFPAAFDGYRIVQFTDAHLASFLQRPEQIDLLVDSINALHPDMIVFTGDLVNTDADELPPFMHSLSRLSAPDGVFSILGNHDYQTYARYLTPEEQTLHLQQLKDGQRQMGWRLLLNEHAVVRRGTDSIAIVGVENDGLPPFPELGDLSKALDTLPGYGAASSVQTPLFKILLSHDPTHWRRKVLPETDIQLTLSGHTHGMQFMLLGWSPSQYIYPEWRGMYAEGERALYVSLGVGGALIPFRFGAWPEINVITLRCK
ncbi:MAG: metallophosphoesterase [Clostridium sp.]|nr:metallophosphoesterase [Clostridium sp.]